MIDYIVALGVWNWLILGAIFLLLELFAPGAFMLWLGLAALAVGLISFGVDWSWQAQLVAFAVLSLALIPVWRRYAPTVEQPSESPLLNRRAGKLCRADLHAGKADRQRRRQCPYRRHGLAGDGTGQRGRQPCADRARGRA